MDGRHSICALLLSLAAMLSTGCAAHLGGGCGLGCGAAACGDSCGSCCSGVNGRGYAFQKFKGCECGCDNFPTKHCVGDSCGGSCEPGCGCEATCGCEASCGCEPACGTEVGCGCEPACGCAEPCGCGTASCGTCGRNCRAKAGERWARFVGCMHKSLCGTGCSGCDGEIYWSEWYNDPPQCCDPCNQCGQWTGPSTYTNPDAPCNCGPSAGGSYVSPEGYVAKPQRAMNIAKQPKTSGPRLR
jgi:hypothetical protein